MSSTAAYPVREHLEAALEVEAAIRPAPRVDPLLTLEGTGDEAAAWQQVAELERERTALHVRQCEVIARGYCLTRGAGRSRDDALGELMGSWMVSRQAAAIALDEALQLVGQPRLVAAALAGAVHLRQVRALLRVLHDVDAVTADLVLATVLRRAPGKDPSRLAEAARRELLRVDPDAARRRRREAAQRRRLLLENVGDGMAELRVLVRAEQGLAVLQRAEAATVHDDGTGRTRDQRRADWVVDQLLTGSENGDSERPSAGPPGAALVLDRRSRRPVEVLVHVPVSTALGLDDEPAELAGYGALDSENALRLVSVAQLRKVCVDSATGQVVHVEDRVHRPTADPARVARLLAEGRTHAGARAQAQAEAVRQVLREMVLSASAVPAEPEPQYRPSAALVRTVKTAHPRCDFPGCRTAARCCDVEHTRAWPRGPTHRLNLASRSRPCHRLKQQGWTPAPLPDGSTQWSSPSGRVYTTPPPWDPPPPLPVDVRLSPPVPPAAPHDDGIPDDELAIAESYGASVPITWYDAPLVEPQAAAPEPAGPPLGPPGFPDVAPF